MRPSAVVPLRDWAWEEIQSRQIKASTWAKPESREVEHFKSVVSDGIIKAAKSKYGGGWRQGRKCVSLNRVTFSKRGGTQSDQQKHDQIGANHRAALQKIKAVFTSEQTAQIEREQDHPAGSSTRPGQ